MLAAKDHSGHKEIDEVVHKGVPTGKKVEKEVDIN
jgi:hypothetical protein